MKDYEANFYLPLMGVEKPVFAIPGNHDWFNALDGFAANLMQPDTARAAIDARVKADLSLSSTTGDRIDRLMESARALAIAVSRAGGPAARAVLRDARRRLFADRDRHRHRAPRRREAARVAQGRARSIEGHVHDGDRRPSVLRGGPVADRRGIVQGSARSAEEQRRARDDGRRHARFRVLPRAIGSALLRQRRRRRVPEHRHRARLARAGPRSATTRSIRGPMPSPPKLDAETPPWKWPAWWWIRRNGAWPFSVEALSAVFDFNRAPFFQSFVEVRVERSRKPGGVRGVRRGRAAALARSADRRRGDARGPSGDDLVEIVGAVRAADALRIFLVDTSMRRAYLVQP